MRPVAALLVLVLLAWSALAAPSETRIVITSPADGAVLSGVATVAGTASPAGAITGVNVTLNLGYAQYATLGAVSGDSVAWSLALDTQGVPDGRYLLLAETVTYGWSNWSMINVTLINQPGIEFTSPAPSAVVSGVVTIAGTASSPYTPLTEVDVSVDRGPWSTASVSGSPTALTWSASVDTTGLSNGPHDFTARVTNAYGRTTTTGRALNVGNPPTYDLRVASVAGSGSDVIVKVANDGNTATRPFDVTLEFDDDGVWRPYSTQRTTAGGHGVSTVRFAYDATNALVGTWALRAVADAKGVVAETDETDNVGFGSATFFTDVVKLPP